MAKRAKLLADQIMEGKANVPPPPPPKTDAPLSALLDMCLEACEALQPLVQAVYDLLATSLDAKTTKADASVFTIADGLVQALLYRSLRGMLGGIVGEEDDAETECETPPFKAGGLPVPEGRLSDLVVAARTAVDAAVAKLTQGAAAASGGAAYAELVAFIDPIDGTREFGSGKGEQCSICIGFASRADGKPVAGIVYRPLDSPKPTWAMGAASEGFVKDSLRAAPPAAAAGEAGGEAAAAGGGFLCSNGSKSPFLVKLCEELGMVQVGSGGAGNKMLLLLEGAGDCYIQDRGVSRWDTCGAQACLEARGGILVKLSPFVGGSAAAGDDAGKAGSGEEKGSGSGEGGGGQLEGYTYVADSETNADFIPGLAKLTKYNAASEHLGAVGSLATEARQLKPFSNVCGLLALRGVDDIERFRAAVAKTAAAVPPSYD